MPDASNGQGGYAQGMSTLRAAVVQLQCQDDVSENLAACRRQVLRAAGLGAQLVLLPENFAYMGAEADKCQHAEALGGGPIQDALAALARDAKLTLIAGGFPERSGDEKRPFNTALVYGPDGVLTAQYRKIHLFDVALADGTVLNESSATSAGDRPVLIEVASTRVGLSICYDLRFPELYRRLVAEGAQVLVVPAAFTLQTGKDHWHPLLRARAIESQCWVLAAGQWGRHPKGRLTYGHSLIVDPWGVVVAECSDGVGVAVADLDFDLLARVRAAVPCLEHRRLV
jgi:predicted amidohydrolase